MQETQFWSVAWEDPLEEMATHSSILAWKIPWTEEPGGLQSVGWQRVGHNWTRTHMDTNQLEAMGWEGGTVPCGLGVCKVWVFFCWHQRKEGTRGFLGISQWEADWECLYPGSFSFWPQTGEWNGLMLGGGTWYPHSSPGVGHCWAWEEGDWWWGSVTLLCPVCVLI